MNGILHFLVSLFVIFYNIGQLVNGSRFESLVVPSEKHQSFLPITLRTLASKAKLGAPNGFRVDAVGEDDVTTAKGVKLRRLVQTYGGYEVYGSVLTAEVTMGGQYTGHVSGDVAIDLSDDIPDPEICRQSIDDVIDVALDAERVKLDSSQVQEEDGRRVVFVRESDNKAVMAYMVEFFLEEKISKPVYIIDACDFTIYRTYNLIQHSGNNADPKNNTENNVYSGRCGDCPGSIPGIGGNARTGRMVYNDSPKCLPLTRSGSGECIMSSSYVIVVNNMGCTSRRNQEIIQFPCSSGYRDTYGNRNGAYGVANDAFYYGHITGLMFYEVFRRKFNMHPRVVIHYGNSLSNAFYVGGDIYFGDGSSFFIYPLVVLDVVAHEYAHGITRRYSNLEYREQSGGINEAFSDITGTVIKYYEYGKYDWYMGRDAMKTRVSLRYMNNPTRDGRSIQHASKFRKGMGVHHSSGVYNYAFYHMVSTYRMKIYQTYSLFLDANMSRWGRTTDFTSGACHVARAAYQKGYSTQTVTRAFARAGVSIDRGSCPLNVRSATIYTGQTRSEILVSADRNPILEISLNKGNATISVTSEENSDIAMVLATDEEAEDVLEEKSNLLEVSSSRDDHVLYVKLKSSNLYDIKVVMQVKQTT